MPLGPYPTLGVQPYSEKVALPTNFLSPADYSALSKFGIEGLPGVAKIYGNGSVTGMLEKVGNVIYQNSQVVRWGEDRRIHLFYEGVTRTDAVFTKTGGHAIRVGENVLINDGAKTDYGYVSATTATTFTVLSYGATGFTVGTTALKVSVLAGTEFKPGTYGFTDGVDLGYDTKTNVMTIVKDSDKIAKSFANEILWVKMKSGGKDAYFWTFKSGKLKTRFENQREAKFWVTQEAEAGSAAAAQGLGKTKGAFEQIAKGGINYTGFPTTKAEWEALVAILDSQGAIQTNMLWLNTASEIAFSNTISAETELGYGVFENGQEEAYSLDFRAFELGGYTFLKTKSKFLNEATGYGSFATAGKVNGLMIPMGTTNVYNESGESTSVPYLHAVSTKGDDGTDRYYYVDPNAAEKDLDAKKTTMLSEFAPVVVGANNFAIFK